MSQMFKEIIADPLRLRSGLEPLGKALREYVKDKQYSPAIKGEEFSEMVMDVFSQVNTGISMPIGQGLAAPSCHPLSACLKDRAFEYIVEHEKDRPPRNLTIAQNGCWQLAMVPGHSAV